MTATIFLVFYGIKAFAISPVEAVLISEHNYTVASLVGDVDDTFAVGLSVEIYADDGNFEKTTRELFRYQPFLNPNTLEAEVLRFCTAFAILRVGCVSIFSEALRMLDESRIRTNHIAGGGIPIILNAYPAPTHTEAFNGHRINQFRLVATANLTGPVFTQYDTDLENSFDDRIYSDYLNLSAGRVEDSPPRVCFIHSVFTRHYRAQILLELLALIHNSGLMNELTAIWVINYGEDITSSPEFPSIQEWFPSVTFLHRSRDSSFFEIPTLRHVAHFSRRVRPSKHRNPVENEVQILYLHTKGVSYSVRHPPIVDWTRMMLFFLVERHNPPKHLLRSGEFDSLGVNYSNLRSGPAFSGNFWWASAALLRKLSPLEWNAGKYDAEHWVMYPFSYQTEDGQENISKGKPYSFHTAKDVVLYAQRYPRSSYVSSGEDSLFPDPWPAIVEDIKSIYSDYSAVDENALLI